MANEIPSKLFEMRFNLKKNLVRFLSQFLRLKQIRIAYVFRLNQIPKLKQFFSFLLLGIQQCLSVSIIQKRNFLNQKFKLNKPISFALNPYRNVFLLTTANFSS